MRFTDHKKSSKVDEIPYGHSYLSPRLWRDIWPLFSSLGLLGCWVNTSFLCLRTEVTKSLHRLVMTSI